MSTTPADASALTKLAEGLSADCRQLVDSALQALQAAVDEREASCARHMELARELQPRMARAVQRLQGEQAAVNALAEPHRARLLAAIREGKDGLSEYSAACERLVECLADELADLRSRLDEVRAGGRMLCTYQRAAEAP